MAVNKPIPKEIGLLDQMQSLMANNAGLTEEIPQELCNCKMLYVINVQANALTGPIPECFHRLTNLTNLRYGWNNFTVLLYESFSSLTSLQWISARENSANHITANIPDIFANMTNLKRLDLAGNNFDGRVPPSLSTLKNLDTIALSGNSGLHGIMPDLTGSKVFPFNGCFLSLTNLCGYPSQSLWYQSFECGFRGIMYLTL